MMDKLESLDRQRFRDFADYIAANRLTNVEALQELLAEEQTAPFMNIDDFDYLPGDESEGEEDLSSDSDV